MGSDNNFKIAGNFQVSDWKTLKENLSTTDVKNTKNWGKAFNIFEVRVKTRFLNPINEILRMNPDEGKGEGFSVVALQCILIEFFEAFYYGKTFTTVKGKNIPDDQYNSSYEMYKSFLTADIPFSNFFCNHDRDNKPAQPNQCTLISVEFFYKKFRCGLLHEAATKGKAIIRTEEKEAGESSDPHQEKLIWRNPSNGQIILYRTPFQKALENYIQDYKRGLMSSLDRRKAFCRKMDELCQL